jgi:hypothetical protein
MNRFRGLTLAAALLILSMPAAAEDAHHPAGAPTTTPPDASSAPTAPGSMAGSGMMSMMHGGPMAGMRQMMAPERIEGRIAFLRTELKITGAQEPVWNAFAEALRANARTHAMPMGGQGAASRTLLQRIEHQEQALSGQLDALRQLKTALQPLYAALDDAQKQAAEQLLLPAPMRPM